MNRASQFNKAEVAEKDSIYPTPQFAGLDKNTQAFGYKCSYRVEWYPMTDDGVTVTGFWDKSKGIRTPEE